MIEQPGGHTMVKLAGSGWTCDCGTIHASDDQRDVFIHIESALRQHIVDRVAPPVPCGVETPCATCGGTRQIPIDDIYAKRCPDCAVETPEAAVEAGAEALREMARNLGSLANANRVTAAKSVLDAAKPHLIAAGWTPPGGN